MAKSGLSNKITTSFIIVSVLAVIATSLIMLLMTRQQFSTYIDNYNQVMLDQWAPIISDYYSQYGSDGLQEYLQTNTIGNGKAMGQRRHHGSMPMGMGIRQGQRLIVTDANNMVVADTQGLLIGQPAKLDSLHSSRELRVDNQPRATLYIISPLGSGLSSLENQFVARLTINTAILAIVIGIIALILGLALGKRISSPLAALSSAIHQLANGKLDERLSLQGDREFMELGRDFNLMAQKLDDVEKNRRRLTADISHELRTPLTFLRGQLEGMQTGSIPLDIESIALLQDEVIRLSHLVKELDNLSLVENRAVSLNFSRFPLSELLEHLIPVSLAMQDKGISYSIDLDSTIKEIYADHDRLLQILLNLLSNAMQHVEQGGQVTLSIQRYRNHLQFAVADNGPGIPPENLPHVFERFYRIDDSRNRREGGMGLGLAIARGYVEAQHGKIWVESSPGCGTVFYFTLPQE